MTTHPIENLAASIASATYVDLNIIEYRIKDWTKSKDADTDVFEDKTRRPGIRDIEIVAMFSQTWGSTALGFGGIGGAAMTDAYTVIIRHNNEFCVYFSGRFAYKIVKPNALFFENMQYATMQPVHLKTKYTKFLVPRITADETRETLGITEEDKEAVAKALKVEK